MKVYSFDVFDTVITRIVQKPTDVFTLVQTKILRECGEIPDVKKHAFCAARVWSEFKARRMSQREDVCLDEIYSVLAGELGLSERQRQYMRLAELETEKAVVVPIAETVRMIENIRSSGNRILFISDMYLEQRFIRELLTGHGLCRDGDPLYVSGEIGLTKSSGRLYDYVLQQERIPSSSLVHYGDNEHSDVAVPMRIGINILRGDSRLGNEKPPVLRSVGKLMVLSRYVASVAKARVMLRMTNVG